MTILSFPKAPDRGPKGPRPIYVCVPKAEEMTLTRRKFGLGYTRPEAQVAFYGGDPNSQAVETRVFTLATLSGRWKHHIVHQFYVYAQIGQPLSAVDQDTSDRLGTDPYLHSRTGHRPPKRKPLGKVLR